ncbi:MAG: hypothetical protein HOP19_01455 [Acidobacteria bacterium]|nr:hypothetical protein [Acidobacteriota bacterium]
MAKEKSSRVTATLLTSTKQALEKLANQYKMSMSAFVQMMVERGVFIEAVIEAGGEIFIRTKDGKELPIANPKFELKPKSTQKFLSK